MGFVSAAVRAEDFKNARDVPIWFQALFANASNEKEETAHFAALGRFIAAYALAEAGVHVAARHHSGLSEDKARVIFGGSGLADIAEMLRKLVENTQDYDEIDTCISQLNVISQERVKVVHRLVEFDPKLGFQVTDKLTVKATASTEMHTYGLSQLKDMEMDCKRIYFRLTATVKDVDGPQMTKLGLSLLSLYGSWQYKPPKRSHKKGPPRARAPRNK